MLDVPFALAFGAGMVATVNPCGFAMLPAYLGFFVGTDDGASRPLRGRVNRALVVSGAMTAGFVTVFGIVGLLVQTVAQSIDQQLSKVTIVIGIMLVLLGVWLLLGHELRINGPKLQRGGRDRTFLSMYLFGVSYATASLSCTLGPFFVALTPTFRHSGVASGLVAFIAYALGMGLIVASATVALAVAQQGWITRLRNLGPIINRVSGGLLVPAVLHGLFDFSILSSTVIDDRGYAGGIAAILAYPLVAIILVVRRHRIEPPGTAPGPRLAAAGTASAHETA